MAEPTFETQPVSGRPEITELKLQGRIYADTAPRLTALLDQAHQDGLRHLIVDANGLEQIDSSGLNAFIDLLKRLRPEKGQIVFFGLNDNILKVFEITKLKKVMGIEGSRDDALGRVSG